MVRPLPHALAATLALTLAAWHLPAVAQSSSAGFTDAAAALVPAWLKPAAPATLADVPPPPAADQAETLGDLLARTLPRDPQERMESSSSVACHICCNFTVALYPDSTLLFQ